VNGHFKRNQVKGNISVGKRNNHIGCGFGLPDLGAQGGHASRERKHRPLAEQVAFAQRIRNAVKPHGKRTNTSKSSKKNEYQVQTCFKG